MSKLQFETCEFSERPLDPSHPVCGKPATHAVFEPLDPLGPFPCCAEHFSLLMNETASAVVIGSPRWFTFLDEMEKEQPLSKAYLDELRRRTG